MKTRTISESLGYIAAINEVIKIITSMPDVTNINGVDLVGKILTNRNDLSVEKDNVETYTIDMVDSKNPHKNIAGEDALLSLNPVFQRNKKAE